MSDDLETNAASREGLSALLDGELDVGPVTQACAHWRQKGEARSAWYAYHLIGDVMRSDDLASDPTHDAGFLEAFRERLAGEPVVLAPRPPEAREPDVALLGAERAAASSGSGRRWAWMAPTAVAAGFVAVVGGLTLTRAPGPSGDGPAAARISQAARTAPTVASFASGGRAEGTALTSGAVAAAEPQTFVASGQLIRDARLDRYLAAHKQFAGSSALGVPSAYLRNATAEVSGR